MPLRRLVLLLIVVIAAAGGTIFAATALWGPDALSDGWIVAVPLVLAVYLGVRFLGLGGRGR